MKKTLLSILLVMLTFCNIIIVYADAPEMTTEFGFATDFHASGDAETSTNKQWKYMYNTNKTENEDGTYANYKGYEEMTEWIDDSAGGYWNNSGGRIYADGLVYSVNACRVAFVWVAPMSGTINIKVNEGDFGRVSSFASELDTDADVVTRITKTNDKGGEVVELEKVVLPAEPEYYYKNNTHLPKELEVNVVAGDKIYFECHGTGSVRREIIWKALVNYKTAAQYYTDDGTLITTDTELTPGMNINYALYNTDSFEETVPMCMALYDSKDRLSAATLKMVTKENNKYISNVTVPSLLNTPNEVETGFSGWSIGVTIVNDRNVFKPIYVSDRLVLK